MFKRPTIFRIDLRLAALLIGVTLSTLDASALNLALPSLAAHFHTDAATVQWAASLYLIGSALAFLPLSGLAGRFGTVRVYRISLLTFSAISLLLGMSPDLSWLFTLRFLQGIAGAGVIGLVPGLAAATFPEQKGWALGMVAGSVAAGTLMGPPIGGFMVDALGWGSGKGSGGWPGSCGGPWSIKGAVMPSWFRTWCWPGLPSSPAA